MLMKSSSQLTRNCTEFRCVNTDHKCPESRLILGQQRNKGLVLTRRELLIILVRVLQAFESEVGHGSWLDLNAVMGGMLVLAC